MGSFLPTVAMFRKSAFEDERMKQNKHSDLEKNRRITGIAFVIPEFILIVIFMVIPLVSVIRYSFTDWDGISRSMNYIGLRNYTELKDIDGTGEMIVATVVYALGVTVITNLLSFIQALLLDKKGKGRINRSLMRSLLFFPSLLSGTIVGILWHIMYNYNTGIINSILKGVGMSPVNWLETYGLTNVAVIVASAWASTGLCMVVYMAGLQSIPQELYESAEIDGASKWDALRHITIPLMASSITINVITSTIAAFKAYELPYFISEGLPGHSTLLITQRIYFYGFEGRNYGRGSALAVILIIIIVLISLIQLAYLKKREDIY